MLYGSIVKERKRLAIIWEKEWGIMDSYKYNLYILSQIRTFMDAKYRLIFMRDNALSQRSKETLRNLSMASTRLCLNLRSEGLPFLLEVVS